MKSILTWFSLSLVAFIVILGIGGLFMSNKYEVTRTIAISAEKEKVHELVSNLNHWEKWGPWADNNPDLQVVMGDLRTGVGASQSWTDKSGSGRLVFTRCNIHDGVSYDLYFNDDKEMCLVDMTYDEMEGGETQVSWTINGEVDVAVVGPYFAKMMDSMLGPMFENGLANLKELAESS